jgi:hypothetical protein
MVENHPVSVMYAVTYAHSCLEADLDAILSNNGIIGEDKVDWLSQFRKADDFFALPLLFRQSNCAIEAPRS